MKKHILLFAAAILLFASCEEIPPRVTGSAGGGGGVNPVEDQKRQVIIEEFTGVRCVACPAGSAQIQTLLAIHGEQLIAVSIHAGEFSPPYQAYSNYDFRTPEGDGILGYLKKPFGYPSAVVNRKQFPGQSSLQVGKDEWAGYIESEKAIPPKLRIDIEPSFDSGNRELTADITLYVDEAITDPDVRLSIMITESGIVDAQLKPNNNTPVLDYTHNHVLRGMLTNFDGQPITEPLTAGATIEQSFSFTVPDEWKQENCEIVAFVSLAGNSKEVIQAHQVHVIE